MTVTQRLNEFIRVVYGGKVAAAAAALQWPRGGLYNYTSGRQEPGKVFLRKFHEAGGNPAWLTTGEGSMFAGNTAGLQLAKRFTGDLAPGAPPEVQLTVDGAKVHTGRRRKATPPRFIPLFLSPVSAGNPTWASDYIEEYVDLHEFFVQHPDETFLVRAQGRSMLYGGIIPGDFVIADRSMPVQAGEVIVAVLNGEPLVKRIEYRDGVTWLMPASDEFEPRAVGPKDKFDILAVATHAVHPLGKRRERGGDQRPRRTRKEPPKPE